MNIVDIIIIILVLFGAILGFKRGLFRELVSALGFIISVIFAFLLKNIVSGFLYERLPFFDFGGIFKGVSVINIIVYEVIAFLFVLAVFMLIFQILKVVTNLIELIFKMTVILSIPSKILGAVVGAIEYFTICFIALYILSLPIISFDLIKDSKLKEPILTKTPLLSSFIDKSVDIFKEFETLKDKYNENTSSEGFNNEALDLMLKYKIITVKSVEKLVDLDKITIDVNILNKYKEES